MFTLSQVDIDSILRKVHRELVVVIGEEVKPSSCKDQKCGKSQIRKVTNADLMYLCNLTYTEDAKTIANR